MQASTARSEVRMMRPGHRRRRHRTARAAIALILVALASPVLGADASETSSASCNTSSSQEVASTLGLKVARVAKDVNGSVSVCWYQVGTNAHSVYVRTQTGDNTSGFKADMKMARAYSENPKVDLSFAPYPAFSTSIGSASYGFTYSVTILKKSTELEIGGAGTTLSRVEALAKKILPAL